MIRGLAGAVAGASLTGCSVGEHRSSAGPSKIASASEPPSSTVSPPSASPPSSASPRRPRPRRPPRASHRGWPATDGHGSRRSGSRRSESPACGWCPTAARPTTPQGPPSRTAASPPVLPVPMAESGRAAWATSSSCTPHVLDKGVRATAGPASRGQGARRGGRRTQLSRSSTAFSSACCVAGDRYRVRMAGSIVVPLS